LLDYDGLFASYELLADQLITEVNKTTIKLYYPSIELTSLVENFDEDPKGIDRLGGRTPVDLMEGRRLEDGSNLYEQSVTEDILGRVYWNNKDFSPEIKKLAIDQNRTFCKLITYIAYLDKLKNSTHAEINGFKCKLFGHITPHGLGTRKYITSYWEVFDGN